MAELQLDIESQILSILEKQNPIEYDTLIKKIDTSKFPRVIEMNTLLYGHVTQGTRNYKLISKAINYLESKGKIKVYNVNPPEFSYIKLYVRKVN